MNRYFLSMIVLLVLSTTQVQSQELCRDSSQESSYANCVINQGFIGCQTESPTCDYYDYYVTPRDVVSKMIVQCCLPSLTNSQQKTCFRNKLREVRLAKAIPQRLRQQTRLIVNNYIADPEVFCTER